ncbi:fatty acid-binding protein, muscle-like [Schistocerca serialis cubense]|uniref:fatty acid-binding protein, muscle-like n=1 Tax=Schistocerca serialis cubense TaxID=2023355 RepID=UPI00214EF1E5|nr:fatty acid-binding protein, muscle-like [Schistocerca serialis cubense]
MVKKYAGKTYQIEKMENMDNYLIAYGVSDAGHREAALKQTTKTTLTVDGEQYKIILDIGSRKTEIPFKLNTEFEETTLDGRKAQTTFTLKGDDVLVQVQKLAAGPTVTTERKFSDTQMIATLTLGDVVAKRFYKAV